MQLDVRTLIVIAIFVAWIPTLIAALVWQTRRHYAGVGRWSIGNLMATVCLICLSLRGVVPDWLSIVLANALAVGAAILFLQGIRLFYGLRLYWWPECLAGAAAIAAGTHFRYANDNMSARIVVWSIALGGFGFACGITLLKRIPAASRFGTVLTGIVFILAGLVHVLRGIYVYTHAPAGDLFAPSAVNAVLFAGAGLAVVGWSFGFILMTNERLVLDSTNAALGSGVALLETIAPADFVTTSVPAAEVRKQVQRIVRSDVFRRSPRMAQFLTITVERTLLGRAAELKEYSLGRDVFNRGEDFDPRIDSIVRVEAQRLRRKLDEYYGFYGKEDTVVVQLRAGSYVPFFTYTKIGPQNHVRPASSNG